MHKIVIKVPKDMGDIESKRGDVPYSERQIFKMVDVLDNDWIVWHSIEWQDDPEMIMGEADFLLFHYRYGFIVIEVKGGLITVEGETFYSKNLITKIKLEIKNPFFKHYNRCFSLKINILKAGIEPEKLFESITSFKGHEKGIILLLIPKSGTFEQKFVERYENFLMQIYVGASMIKFNLSIYEFE